MLINEYRLYLPSSVAFAGAVGAAFIAGGRAARTRRAVFAALTALALVLAVATFARNSLWRTETGLWEDAALKSPKKVRPRNNLCNSYVLEGKPDMAIGECGRALSMDAYNTMSLLNLGMAYVQKEQWDEATKNLDVVLLLEPENAAAHRYAGIAYGRSGRPEKGIGHLETARRLKPHAFGADALEALGEFYNAAGGPPGSTPGAEAGKIGK
jgi:tetratricopeptide (TPR) repeat protein